MWFHGDAKNVACSRGIRKKIATPSTWAPPLEHESEQRELPGPTRRGSVVFRRRPQAMSRVDRALHGQRANLARRVQRNCTSGLWWHERALHLGQNAGWPNELGVV